MVHYQPGHLDQCQNTAYIGRQLDMDDGGNFYGFDHAAVKHQVEEDSWFKSKLGFCCKNSKKSRLVGWKPLSLSPLVLGTLAFLTLLLAAGIEALAQRSAAKGALALAPAQDDIPYYAMFGSLYGPNIAAAMYSLLWSWVDLDVKRMQPWFELSRPTGATGENSIFLEYASEFVPFVPIKAAKKKHWATFLSGTAMAIVFLILTPLQSSIMGTKVVTQSRETTVVARSTLQSSGYQSDNMTPQILNIGYAVGWLGQMYPPFATSKYALFPYYIDEPLTARSKQASITSTTTMVWTDLQCWPAETITRIPPFKARYTFSNGQSCNATVDILLSPPQVFMQYIGYYSNAYSDRWLNDYGACPPTSNSTHQTLALWAKQLPTKPDTETEYNITAIFCQPSYFKQQVLATVDAKTYAAQDSLIQPLGKPEPLTETEFNSTAFEYMIVNGMPEFSYLKAMDAPYKHVVDQGPRLLKYNLMSPTSNMAGYAFAGQNYSTDDYSDPKIMANAYNHAHKYLFSIAVNHFLTNQTSYENMTGTSTYQMSGIVVSRLISACVEGILLLISILTLLLLCFCSRAPCNLDSNPNSITRLISICRNSPALLSSFRNLDNGDAKSLLSMFRNTRFRLLDQGGNGNSKLRVEIMDGNMASPSENDMSIPKYYYKPVRPFALTRPMGFIFATILLAAIAVIAFFKAASAARNGLSRPSDRFEVLQILENYLPTAFATLVEPFWVYLNRNLCLIQPFRDLTAGKAPANRTINTTYTAIPPQLAIWRAIKSRHFLLVLLCATTLLANLLGIGMGALFNEDETISAYAEGFRPSTSENFTTTSVSNFFNATLSDLIATDLYQDHFHTVLSNITDGTPLPPWISPEYFFLPQMSLAVVANTTASTYLVQTRGFTANANCTAVSGTQTFLSSNKSTELSQKKCPDPVQRAIEVMTYFYPTNPRGLCAIEHLEVLKIGTSVGDCDNLISMGWGRTSDCINANNTITATFAFCKTYMQTAIFNVSVDANGHVLSYKRVSNITTAAGDSRSSSAISSLIDYTSETFRHDNSFYHNDTTTGSMMTHLLAKLSKSRNFLDPKAPAPDSKQLIPLIHEAYRRSFVAFLGRGQNELFLPAKPNHPPVPGLRETKETKIFLNNPAFIISISVLSLNVIVAIIFYSRPMTSILPRMPTSIGSVIAYIAPSYNLLKHSINNTTKITSTVTYSFGRYRGVDGRGHIGIEADPHVVPIDSMSIQSSRSCLDYIPKSLTRRRKEDTTEETWI